MGSFENNKEPWTLSFAQLVSKELPTAAQEHDLKKSFI